MYHKRKNNNDLIYVLSNLREPDIKELQLLMGDDWYNRVLKNWKQLSGVRIACLDNGKPVAIFGVMKVGDVGSVGMLATQDIEKELRSFLILGRKWVDVQLRKYNVLTNFVYSENTKAIRWLKWLGFSVENHSGIGDKFLRFQRVKGEA
jgi:hypothetical protein